MRTTTLGELGPRFPIGFVNDGALEKTFQLRPYKGKIDRFLGLWKTANGEKYTETQMFACEVAKLVSLLCTQAGTRANAFDKDGDSTAAGELWIQQWNMSDVLYLYFYARVQALGPELIVPTVCQNAHCKKPSKIKFDLNTLEVRVAETVEDTFIWYDLKTPIEGRGGNTISSIKLEPFKWATMSKPGMIGNATHTINMRSLQDSIVAINRHKQTQHGDKTLEGQPYQVIADEIDELTKADLAALDLKVADLSIGVDIQTEVKCPHCGAMIIDPLAWDYGYFFGLSFQPET